MPSSFEQFRVEGLKQHLRPYSGLLSARNAITRLEDPVWLAAWDAALSGTAGSRILFRGSELGVLALRALQHGAAHALCVEAFPPDARIAAGMVQKHFLTPWHRRHGEAIQGWSEEERRASFEQFASAIDIVSAGSQPATAASYDCFVFPHIDHTLLGTGIVKAIRRHCAGGRAAPARYCRRKLRFSRWVCSGNTPAARIFAWRR
jgi:protein arginine N-methyltransferase 7